MITFLLNLTSRAIERGRLSPRFTARLLRIAPSTESDSYLAALIENLQLKRLRATLRRAMNHSGLYRERMDAARVHPRSLRHGGDIATLQPTTGNDLAAWRELLCVRDDEVAHLVRVAAENECLALSFSDVAVLENTGALVLRVLAGKGNRFRAVVATNAATADAARFSEIVRCGRGLAVTYESGALDQALRWVQEVQPDLIVAPASDIRAFLSRISDAAPGSQFAGGSGRPLLIATLPIGLLPMSSQPPTPDTASPLPGVDTDPGTLRLMESQVPLLVGSPELGPTFGLVPPNCRHVHLNDLQFLTEILDPRTGEASAEGELVVTTLARTAMPLLRFRTGRMARWTTHQCGLPVHTVDLLPDEEIHIMST